jgi:acetolactate synthase-1/2/3 large subunit
MDSLLTGAEATAEVLSQHDATLVFGYPGTSELALCDSVERHPRLRLVNGRGDKESAFMAAGASLLGRTGVALLHGARGLTNAAGAIGDARRNEIPALYLVGMASTGSARFLPPHGEPDLLSTMGGLADWWWEASADCSPDEFVAQLRAALTRAAGPALFGIPQDVAEEPWVPASAVNAHFESSLSTVPTRGVDSAVDVLDAAAKPLFLVDDYALRHQDLRPALSQLADLLGAPVMQLRYRRGPMLFEHLRADEVGNFVGSYNPFSSIHRGLMAECDALVTVEDRNIYRRVVGELPGCRKVAVTGNAAKARKNEYLSDGDVVVEGDVADALWSLVEALKPSRNGTERWYDTTVVTPAEARVTPEPASAEVEESRSRIVRAIAATLASAPGLAGPVLVDDSQMFGGLISERYDLLPPSTRVFGDHGGFVGGGLATAVGLALESPQRRVLCALGDQGFVNAFQGLVAAAQESAPVVFLVCNNGESVSLKKQRATTENDPPGYLDNVPGLSYRGIAEALGVPGWRVAMGVSTPGTALEAALREAFATGGPALVELVLPSDPEVWRGIWITQGFEATSRQCDTPRIGEPPRSVATGS